MSELAAGASSRDLSYPAHGDWRKGERWHQGGTAASYLCCS